MVRGLYGGQVSGTMCNLIFYETPEATTRLSAVRIGWFSGSLANETVHKNSDRLQKVSG